LEVVSAAITGIGDTDRSGTAQPLILTDRSSLSGPLGEQLQVMHPNSVVRLTGTFDPSAILQARKIAEPVTEKSP
jgi:hypothetical protein